MSALIRVPKKLKDGMAVVVKLDITYKLTPAERLAGIKTGVWLKGVIDCHDDSDSWGIIINKHWLWLPVFTGKSDHYHGIIIRSVAIADNKTEADKRALARARAKYRAEVLGK